MLFRSLSDEFLEDVRQMDSRNLAVELLEKLLRDEIKARARNNVVQEKKYGDRLLETLRKYHNRAIETAQVIEELIQMAKEFQATLAREATLGLGHDEIAFYDALANNESAVRELGDDVLKRTASAVEKCLKTGDVLARYGGEEFVVLLPGVDEGLSMVARWLMAWGDAFMTGMLAAIFVAFKPQWLATWSDQLYLRKPPT